MTKSEHLERFKRGARVWNAWRLENPDEEVNLHGVDLRNAHLPAIRCDGVNLSDADLSGATLNGCEFRNASLLRTNFAGANLEGARFNGSDLFHANLQGADLTRALFMDARIIGADLRGVTAERSLWSKADLGGADLRGARLKKANFGWAMLANADLREAKGFWPNFQGAVLEDADLSGASFAKANFEGSSLRRAKLVGTRLKNANLREADLRGADLTGAKLRSAKLDLANLRGASLVKARLAEASLRSAVLVGADLSGAALTDCDIYGISAWDLVVDEGTKRKNLNISPEGDAAIHVDSLQVAQFIYLLLNNRKIRDVIDTVTSKVVLILGRFRPENKKILDSIKDSLSERDYVPVLFDFTRSTKRSMTETVRLIAHFAKFVIVDLSDASSVPHELASIVPFLPSVPVKPIIRAPGMEYAMFEDWEKFPWVLEKFVYDDEEHLIANLGARLLAPAEAWTPETIKSLREKAEALTAEAEVLTAENADLRREIEEMRRS